MMNCEQVTELLPWLLNGAMDAVEQRQVKEHIVTCLPCRQELAVIRSGWIVYQSHVPTDALVDYAFRRSVANPPPEEIERHLATCGECAEQFEMARKSYNWASGEEPDPAPKRKIRWWEVWRWREAALAASGAMVSDTRRFATRWQYATVAASFVALIAVGGWLWSWQRARAWQTSSLEQQRAMQEQVTGLEAETQRLRQTETQLRQQQDEANRQIAQLQEKAKQWDLPQINTPLFDLRPSERFRLKDRPPAEQTGVNELEIPPGAQAVTLILNSESEASYSSYSIEIVKAREVIWSAEGLRRDPSNDYTLSLPVQFLTPGNYTLNVYGKDKGRSIKAESYQIRIRLPGR